MINACNAALQSDKLYAMASRTRKQYLRDIVKDHASSVSLEQVGGGALGGSEIVLSFAKDGTIFFFDGSFTKSIILP